MTDSKKSEQNKPSNNQQQTNKAPTQPSTPSASGKENIQSSSTKPASTANDANRAESASKTSTTNSKETKADKPATTPNAAKSPNPVTQKQKKAPEQKSARLPLVIAIIAILASGANFLYFSKKSAELSNIQASSNDQLLNIQKDLTSVHKQTENQNTNGTGGVSEAQVKSLIADSMTQVQQYNDQQLTEMLKKVSSNEHGLSQSDIEEIVQQTLAKQSKSNLDEEKQSLAEYRVSLEKQIQAKLANLETQPLQKQDDKTTVLPIIDRLKLAEILASQGQIQITADLLNQVTQNLQSIHANEKVIQQAEALQKAYKQAATALDFTDSLNKIINSIPVWKFHHEKQENILKAEQTNTDKPSWNERIKQVGNHLLSSMVIINKKEQSGLVAIAHDPYLAAAIEENARSGFNLLQTSLLLGNLSAAQHIATDLKENISHYFNQNQSEVKQALDLLNQVQSTNLPNLSGISDLVNALKQTQQ